MASLIEIPSLSAEIRHHTQYVLTDAWQTIDGQPENTMPRLPIVDGGIIIQTSVMHTMSAMNCTYCTEQVRRISGLCKERVFRQRLKVLIKYKSEKW